MRAVDSLLREPDQFIRFVHASRRRSIWRAVKGLLKGGRLWLTALGRDLPGETSDKHRIKAADRLLGNAKLHRDLLAMYRARAAWLLRSESRPVLSVDWTGVVGPFYALSAGLCCVGRSVPLYSEVHLKARMETRAVHRRFLVRLKAVLPENCRPIIITDAGFYADWFDDVGKHGWDFIGRVRGRVHAFLGNAWVSVKTLYDRATRRPKNVGIVRMRKKQPVEFRMVLAAAPKSKGRHRFTRKGTIGGRTQDKKYRAQMTEPWLLATSLNSQSKFIVRTYSLRMQIEETFRDTKNHRYGWALGDCRSRSAKRLEVLLFIAALAYVLVEMVGRVAENQNIHHRFQANTVRNRRVLSLFFLGRLVLHSPDGELDATSLSQAFRDILNIVHAHGQLVVGG